MAEPHLLLNQARASDAAAALRRCCGSERWVQALLAARPYASSPELYALAEQVWRSLSTDDYLEAFSQHPQIGENLSALRQRFATTASLSAREQAGVAEADEAVLLALREGNRAYRERFGFIFIVCASGKSAQEMLALLEARIENDRGTELALAAAEQAKITRLRLEGLSAFESLGAPPKLRGSSA
jgi:2-oxo-4-hydroxy-4-carboxy-5-ureidoimidazoline decarboxylase